jgi:penicillin amidase
VAGARDALLDWDHRLTPDSWKAALYASWETAIRRGIPRLAVPEEVRGILGGVSMKRIIDWIGAPPPWFALEPGGDPTAGRDAFLATTFRDALEDVRSRFGADAWRYGDVRYKHVTLRHPLSGAVSDEWRERLEVGPHPRGGNGYTVGQTGFGDNQTSGASFKIIAEAGDWDTAVFTNTPGQVGDPAHPMYDNLFEGWAKDQYFPLYYSRDRVEAATAERIALEPGS